MALVKHFKELRVYKQAFAAATRIYELSKRWPKEERYSLTDQIRRSSRSVCSNIAEAWRKRRYPAHFVSKLSDSDGEQAETQHWLDTSFACEYISEEEHAGLLKKCKEVGKMLGKMMQEPEKWCGQFINK